MKIIGFIGVYDKIDMLLNIAKILTVMKNKVLIVASTINQKAKYVVPTINPTVSYITSFEDIDVAIGFNNIEEIKKYAGISTELPYDFVLVDADTQKSVEDFRLKIAEKRYFVTSFDVYSLKKGMEIINSFQEPIELTKVLYSQESSNEENEYLDFLSLDSKVIWDEEKIYFPMENGDLSVLMENQRVQKIKFKKLSMQYKEALLSMVQQILKHPNNIYIKKTIRIIEKGV